MRAVSVSACALLVAAALPSAAAAQRIDGRVIDSATRQPIAAVAFRLMKGDAEVASALSDSAGRFSLEAPELGRYHLRGSRVGYADAQSAVIDLNAQGTFTAELAMGVEAVEVAPIAVTVPRNRYLETRGFYERLQTGTGDYLTGDQLRARNQQSLVDVLRGMRGIKIQRVNWKSEVYFAGANCLPQIIVDGVTVRYGGKSLRTFDALTVEDLVNVSHIEGIEVYRGSSGVPVEFEGPNASCGVIVVWTRLR
jgi:hypothetical protein